MATKLFDLSAQREIDYINRHVDLAPERVKAVMRARRSYLMTAIMLGTV